MEGFKLPLNFYTTRDVNRGMNIHDEDGVRLNYKVISYDDKEDADFFYSNLMHLSHSFNFFPQILCPFQVGNDPKYYIALYCKGNTPISLIVSKELFDKVSVYYFGSKPTNVYMYASLLLKRMIWSIFRTVVACLDSPIQPIISEENMYLSDESDVVFTCYKRRVVSGNENAEAEDMKKFFKKLMKKKTTESTLVHEMKAFISWLENVNLRDFNNTNMNEIFKNVLFWTYEMRISYVMMLHDYVEGGNKITDAMSAFDIENDTDNWRALMEKSGNKALRVLLQHGDTFFNDQCSKSGRNAPSWRRSPNLSTTPEYLFEQGLTRMRDIYFHVVDIHKEIGVISPHKALYAKDMQHIFQKVFPNHMVELAKVQHLCAYDAANEVLQLLWRRPFPYKFDDDTGSDCV